MSMAAEDKTRYFKSLSLFQFISELLVILFADVVYLSGRSSSLLYANCY